eukprot:6038807-Amphidinium_carterae.3
MGKSASTRQLKRSSSSTTQSRPEAEATKAKARPSTSLTMVAALAAASTIPPKPRQVPLPKGQQIEDAVQGKTTTPQTPTQPALSSRLRLNKNNFVTAENKPDAYYESEKKIPQVMIQRSYIRILPTMGYHRATPEIVFQIREFYDGFEIYTFDDKFNPNKPINEVETKFTTLQQLLSISYSYAPDFFNTMKLQKMDYLRERGFDEEKVQHQETVLQREKILELYT